MIQGNYGRSAGLDIGARQGREGTDRRRLRPKESSSLITDLGHKPPSEQQIDKAVARRPRVMAQTRTGYVHSAAAASVTRLGRVQFTFAMAVQRSNSCSRHLFSFVNVFSFKLVPDPSCLLICDVSVLDSRPESKVFRIQLFVFNLKFFLPPHSSRRRDPPMPMPIILMRLTTSRIYELQKQGRDHAAWSTLKKKYTDHPFPQVKRHGPRSGSVMHVRRSHRVVISSSLATGSTFISTTKNPVVPLSTRFSVQILPPPCPPPRPLLHW